MTETQTQARNEAATDLLLMLTQPGIIQSTRVRDGILRKVDAALREQTRTTVDAVAVDIREALAALDGSKEVGFESVRPAIARNHLRSALAALPHDSTPGEEASGE